jgi:hypothetical protein
LKASDKHFCWMAVNIPGTAPRLGTVYRKTSSGFPKHQKH